MTLRKYIGLIVLLMGVPTAQAQEEKYLDDKPQDVYGPTTTLFTTQENIQYNLGGYKTIAADRTIRGMHRFTFVQQCGNKLQNLGNNGTATKPIFYVMPEHIGATSGFHAYELYFRSPHQFRYYDTKSPYSKLYVMLARFGSFFADICHSRNVTPHWNIGVNFRNMMTDKEWIPANPPGDRNVMAYGLDLFTHFKTENERYQLLAHCLLMKHRVRETGGIYVFEKSTKRLMEKKLLKGKIIDNRLRTTENSDARRRFHLYHQWALAEQLWVYHELGLRKKQHLFSTDPLQQNDKIFLGGQTNDPQAAIKATTVVGDAQNELGVKGDRQGWFYCGYYRHKNIALRHQETKDAQHLHEHYVGLRTRYQLADRTALLHLQGEYLFPGLYKARLAYESASFELACERIRYKPSFLAQCYHGYYRNWDNQFTPLTATQVSGGFRLAERMVQLRPHISFTRVNNHIYFKHPRHGKRTAHDKLAQRCYMLAIPEQDKKHADMITLGTDLALALGAYIHWDSELTVAKVLGPSAKLFSLPTVLLNSRLYYAQTTAEGNGTMETGIDVHWRSAYKADAYDPVMQQFYLQDEFTLYSYPVIDLFLNFRIKSFSAFLKFSHLNEYLLSSPSYFVTPLYPGQKRSFDIGLNWSFFD